MILILDTEITHKGIYTKLEKLHKSYKGRYKENEDMVDVIVSAINHGVDCPLLSFEHVEEVGDVDKEACK